MKIWKMIVVKGIVFPVIVPLVMNGIRILTWEGLDMEISVGQTLIRDFNRMTKAAWESRETGIPFFMVVKLPKSRRPPHTSYSKFAAKVAS